MRYRARPDSDRPVGGTRVPKQRVYSLRRILPPGTYSFCQLTSELQHVKDRSEGLRRELVAYNDLVTTLGDELDREHERTAQLENDRRYLDEDLDLARIVQKSFLPRERRFGGLTAFCHLESARVIGGDFYDLVPMRDGTVACIVADVAGKGIAAALTMALSIGIFREAMRSEQSPAAILRRTNALLRENTPEEHRFVSASAAVLDSAHRTVTYASAGHEGGLLWQSETQRCRLLKPTGLLLGVEENSEYAEIEVSVETGDRLILCTDGITEAFNNRRDCYGVQRVVDLVSRHANDRLEVLSQAILNDVELFRAGEIINDDVTLVVVEFD